jgi:hypothetical protein
MLRPAFSGEVLLAGRARVCVEVLVACVLGVPDSGRRGHDGGDHGEPYDNALQAEVLARGGELGAVLRPNSRS